MDKYEYYTSSDTYKEIISTGSVTLQDSNMTLKVSAVNGMYVLIISDGASNDSLVNTFKEIK